MPCHLQRGAERPGLPAGDLPVTERVAAEILSLPMYAELTEEEIGSIADLIKAF